MKTLSFALGLTLKAVMRYIAPSLTMQHKSLLMCNAIFKAITYFQFCACTQKDIST